MKLLSSQGLSLASALACLLSSAAAFAPPPVFENTAISRKLDLTGSYVRETVAIGIKNVGDKEESVYYYAFDPETFGKVAVFEGRLKTAAGAAIIHATPSQETDDDANFNFFELQLPRPLKPNEEASIHLGIALINTIVPVPEAAHQDDSQILTYEDSRFALSAYPTVRQSLKVVTVGLNPEDVNAQEAQQELGDEFNLIPEIDDNSLHYGPYDNVKAGTASNFLLRYEYPRAVIKAVQLKRDIWISHWGSTASFEETYQLHHFGTKLKEGFSRLNYMRRSSSYNLNVASYKGLELQLPAGAREPYYTDLVGNVSTSSFSQNEDRASLVIRPRYPVFGGWNYNFTIGWSVDLDQYVKALAPHTYLLKVPLLDGPDEMPYDEAIVNIILPEGASDIDVAALQPFEPESLYFTKSFLDFQGRPSVQLVYKNLIDSYKRTSIFVTYKYTPQAAYKKPLFLSGVFAAVFTAVLFLSKVDIKISSYNPIKDKKKTK